jgi:hypothetical protein
MEYQTSEEIMRKYFWVCLICISLVFDARCDVPLHFQYVFGPNPSRAKNMKAKELFDSPLQINLAEAAVKGDTNQLQRLINQGADVNYPGRRAMKPLFWALINQSFPGFKFLLDNGADPNSTVEIKKPAPENALTMAASMDDPRYLEELLKHGANPNLPAGNPSQETPIFSASFYRQTNNILVLLKYRADIDWKTTGNYTALHQAINGNAFEMALFLYHLGANPLISNKWGYTPVDTLQKFKDNGPVSRADRRAYKQLLEEWKKAGLLEQKQTPSSISRSESSCGSKNRPTWIDSTPDCRPVNGSLRDSLLRRPVG